MPLSPPRPSLPSLKALRAFEAAARHEGFVGAADELCVTAAAIAQQVRALEDWVGRPLFHRKARGLQLTSEARAMLPRLVEAFDALAGAAHGLRRHADRREIQIAALPCVAQLWLSPRLGAMRKAFPNLEFSVVALENPPDFTRELFDLGLFFVGGSLPNCTAHTLVEDRLFPVCSPQLLAGRGRSLDLAGLADMTLLHDARWRNDWARWLRHAGDRRVDARRGSTFSLYSMAVEAAIEEAGLLIGHSSLLQAPLGDGRLLAPIDDGAALLGPPLSLILPEGRGLEEGTEAVVAWLRETASPPRSTVGDRAG